MDIDPRQVTGQSSFDDALTFLRDIGRALNRDVCLTDEAEPQSVWFSYDASRDELTFKARENW